MEPIVVRNGGAGSPKQGGKERRQNVLQVLELKGYQEGMNAYPATLPGTDHACSRRQKPKNTDNVRNGHAPLENMSVGPCPRGPILSVRGQDTVTGKDAIESTTSKVESGKGTITTTRGKWCFVGSKWGIAM